MKHTKRLDIREVIALMFSAVILLGTVVYWVVQILGVRETLNLAGG